MIVLQNIFLLTITLACVCHLNRMHQRQILDWLTFSGSAAAAFGACFEAVFYAPLFGGLAVIFLRHFCLERRNLRIPPHA